jgi:preprotein translocase subunit SecD
MKFSHLVLLVLAVAAVFSNLPETLPYNVKLVGKTFKGTWVKPALDLTPAGLAFKRDLTIKEGLDLQGGTHLVFQADTGGVKSPDRSAAIEAVRTNIERRVNYLGVSEPVIQTSQVGDSYRLIVELAGIKDVNQAINLIGTTAQLDFRELILASPSPTLAGKRGPGPTPAAPVGSASPSAVPTSPPMVFSPTGLTGSDLVRATVQFNSGTGQPEVGLEFTPEGTKKFAAITKRNVGKPLAIYLDQIPLEAPTVNTEIPDGRAVIQGSFTTEEVKQTVAELNSGALPVPVKLIEERTVGATLGSDSIRRSLIAGGVGLAVVGIFMIFNYGLWGLVADTALVLYILFSLSLFRLIPVTLTLAGIAGFILSIGMAVDANILIFERMKEEIRWGRPVRAVLDLGFSRAWTSIRDSNASSLITCTILFWFGTGSVRGFALTLAVGILVSLFTAVNVTKLLLQYAYHPQEEGGKK